MNSLHSTIKDFVKKQENVIITDKRYRLSYHLMPPVGWLNDPNGLCQFQEDYHIFFQYSPFDAEGGLKLWGHFKSSDFIHWDYMGAPLLPDEAYDCHGVYSGSAYCEDGKLHVFYTGNVKYTGDFDYILEGRGSAVIQAEYDSSNGMFSNKSLVLENKDYPEDLSCHVRDPKVYKEDGSYYMALGARSKSDVGEALLWKSDDLKNWSLFRRITSRHKFGFMWECPDIFSIDSHKILSISPQGVEKSGIRFWNVYQSGWFLLSKESEDCGSQSISGDFHEWDYGFDFYAPQTFQDEKGRRILIGWMGMPDAEEYYQNPTVELGWQHALTLPRELSFKNGVVCQMPVKEMTALRQQKVVFESTLEIVPLFELQIENPSGESFSICAGGMEFIYDKIKGRAVLQFSGTEGCGRDMRMADVSDIFALSLYVDSSSAEWFLNHGEFVFTTRFYPLTEKIKLEVNGQKILHSLWMLSGFEFGHGSQFF